VRVPDTGSEMPRQGIDPEPLFVLLRLKPNRQTAASHQEGLNLLPRVEYFGAPCGCMQDNGASSFSSRRPLSSGGRISGNPGNLASIQGQILARAGNELRVLRTEYRVLVPTYLR
jgi:hypothetical protein